MVKRSDSHSTKPVREGLETLTFKKENASCICQALREKIVIPFGHHQFRPVDVPSRVNSELWKVNVSYKKS